MKLDRTVHGMMSDGGEIVRYDRAGKWFVEYDARRMIPCWQVSVREAARLATEKGATAVLGRAGGKRFDAEVKHRRALGDDEEGST